MGMNEAVDMAILTKYKINGETYRHFRDPDVRAEETPRELYNLPDGPIQEVGEASRQECGGW